MENVIVVSIGKVMNMRIITEEPSLVHAFEFFFKYQISAQNIDTDPMHIRGKMHAKIIL